MHALQRETKLVEIQWIEIKNMCTERQIGAEVSEIICMTA